MHIDVNLQSQLTGQFLDEMQFFHVTESTVNMGYSVTEINW